MPGHDLGAPLALYDRMLPDRRRVEFQMKMHARVRTEVVWLNFEPGMMHRVEYAGLNSINHLRSKRKAARRVQGCRRMPPSERLAVFSVILAVEAE